MVGYLSFRYFNDMNMLEVSTPLKSLSLFLSRIKEEDTYLNSCTLHFAFFFCLSQFAFGFMRKFEFFSLSKFLHWRLWLNGICGVCMLIANYRIFSSSEISKYHLFHFKERWAFIRIVRTWTTSSTTINEETFIPLNSSWYI